MSTVDLFSEDVKKRIQGDIDASSAQEIFLVARFNDKKVIDEYFVLARGNKNMVPAIINDLKPGDIVIHNHPSGDLSPSAQDIRVASQLGNDGIGFMIIDNQVSNFYVVVEPKIPQEEIALNDKEIISLFEPKGNLDQLLTGYEYRQQQVDVVKEVINSFNQHLHIFIEAGTGTGKSFAYLLPALYYSYFNQQPVVISTNTINLQEQLVDKDLVFLKKVFPFSFKAVLVKGRSNYICKRKINNMEKVATDKFLDDQDKEIEFVKILNWLEDTKTGTKSELSFVIKTDLWPEIASESDLCLRTSCPFFKDCYFMKARKEVFSADILIVNHHLLISDAILKNEIIGKETGILPKYGNLIIDEAHNFADVATDHLGKPFYGQALLKYLQRLNSNKYSLIPRLRNMLSPLNIDNKKELLAIIDLKIIQQIQKLKDLTPAYIEKLKEFLDKNEEYELRLTEDILQANFWQEFRELGEKILAVLNNLGFYLKELDDQLKTLSSNVQNKLEDLMIELIAAYLNCQRFINSLDFNLSLEDKDYVFWLKKGSFNKYSQENAPLDIADKLRDILWNYLDNLVLTSATLTVNNKFNYFKEVLGLNKSSYLQVESPFDYKKQASLLIPKDIPPANSANFLEKVIKDLNNILLTFQGATLVLFTSYRMLNYCQNKMENSLNKAGINLLAQGKYPRTYIIEHFKKNNKQIIFGTVSFWEGVDIKGDNLKYLIIMKLPFPVPSEPIAAARMEKLKKEGKNPFYHYSIPRAVIRFKQGFGRLIRSRDDQGLVISLDNRLISKSYGKIFLNSLPTDCPVKEVEFKSIY